MSPPRHDTVVFLGPTLSLAEARAVLPDACYLPPARCGDILRARRLRPLRIAIIDGIFERTAAIWHKELLLALSHGIELHGASSMGALRAAEMQPYGMIGHGRIFEAFRDGDLTDDDEVAVLHAEVYAGYASLSDSMVNIRATLDAALAAGVMDTESAGELLSLAKRTFYHQRSLAALVESILATDARARFNAFLDGGGAVDQKKADALSLLSRLASSQPVQPSKPPEAVRTLWLRTLEREIQCRALPWPDAPLSGEERIACNARFLDDIYRQHVRMAKWLALLNGIGESLAEGNETGPMDVTTLVDPVWGLPPDAVSNTWAADNDLTPAELEALYRRLANVRTAMEPAIQQEGDRWLLGLLRLEGRFEELDSGSCDGRDALAIERLAEWDTDRYAVYFRTAGLWQSIDHKLLTFSRADSELTVMRSENRFRLTHDLSDPEAAIRWCQTNGLSRGEFQWLGAAAWRLDILDELCTFELMEIAPPSAYESWLPDALRLTGWYGRLRSGRWGGPRLGTGDAVEKFFAWHRCSPPADLEAYALAHDFIGEYAFSRELKSFIR